MDQLSQTRYVLHFDGCILKNIEFQISLDGFGSSGFVVRTGALVDFKEKGQIALMDLRMYFSLNCTSIHVFKFLTTTLELIFVLSKKTSPVQYFHYFLAKNAMQTILSTISDSKRQNSYALV